MKLGKPLIIAHRGASAYEAENTLRAVRRALEWGADLIEVDVRLSMDGHVVVIHDERVDRTTNGKGCVKDMTLDDLKGLDAGLGEKIPTLGEVLDLVKGRAGLIVEIKVLEAVEKVVQTIEEKRMVREAIVSSFDPHAVKRVKELNSDIKTCVLCSFHPLEAIRLTLKARAEILYLDHRYIDADAVVEAHKHGLTIYSWATDDPNEAERLIKIGVDGITTNKPDLLQKR